MAELRRVRNLSELPFFDAYGGQHFLIEPGAEALVPLEACDLWFGDNNLRNEVTRNYRNEEWERLKVRYGAYADEALWQEACPKVEVLTVDNEAIETVLSDPHGTKVHVANPTIDEQTQLVQMIQQQQRDLETLRAEYQRMARSNEALAAGVTEEDKPVAPASRRARNQGKPLGVEEDAPVGP